MSNKNYRSNWPTQQNQIQHNITIMILSLLLVALTISSAYVIRNEKNAELGTKLSSHIQTDQEQEPGELPASVTDTANFKSWMDYRSITAVASNQYELQKVAKTDALGRRIVNGMPLIAIGSGWGASVGDYVIVVFKNSAPKGFIVGDIKSDAHTTSDHKVCEVNGSIIEFIVDKDYIPKKIRSSGNFSDLDVYSSPIITIYQEVLYDGSQDYQN